MNGITNTFINILNNIGRMFCDFSLTMFVQASVLIVLLFIIDILIRKKVRATFRYWIWMLVFIKLVLPPALSLPTGIGNWLGEYFVVNSAAIESHANNFTKEIPVPADPINVVSHGNTQFSPRQIQQLQSDSRPVTPEVSSEIQNSETLQKNTPVEVSANSVSLIWQGGLFLIWFVGVLVLFVLLVQRIFFVRSLIAQSEPAKNRFLEILEECSKQLGISRKIKMRLSYSASSPAVCGVFKPVILIPKDLLGKISHDKFKAILIHELSHIKRKDLLINCVQTILQILYFYNPLVWLANSIVRRIREQAVDEMVLVALRAEAKSYSNTLIDVAEMAFSRPALSLRLVGVVESKKALSERIKHILSRPIPKSAKLGILGLIVILVAAAILLPMSKSDAFNNWFGRNELIQFTSLDSSSEDHNTNIKNYTVSFKKGEKLAIIAELFQTGKPMRNLGCKIFYGSERPQELSVLLNKRFLNKEQTDIRYDLRVTLGGQVFNLNEIWVHTPVWFNSANLNFFSGSSIPPAKLFKGQQYIEFENLISERFFPDEKRGDSPRIWIPGYVTDIPGQTYCILVKMLPLSQFDKLSVAAPYIDEKIQLPDGTYLPPNASVEELKSIADDYLISVKEELLSSQMPLPKLVAHKYYKYGEPIPIASEMVDSGQWKPSLNEIDMRTRHEEIFFVSIDGKEHNCRMGVGPFKTGGLQVNIPEDLYDDRNLQLPPGRHTVAYGWRDVDVTSPEEPGKPVHFARLLTKKVEFEVVNEIPDDYYSKVYEDGWDEVLANNIDVQFTDYPSKYNYIGSLLSLVAKPLPFGIAFDVYAQAEGSEEREYVGQLARRANLSVNNLLFCDDKMTSLNWDNVGQKRYRLILIPSEKAAIAHPPVHHYYGREYITEWAAFEKSRDFDMYYERFGKSNISNWVVEDVPGTRFLAQRELSETDKWVSAVGSIIKTNGHYLIPESGLSLTELIREAGYNKDKLDESYIEVGRTIKQGDEKAQLIFSRNVKTLFSGKESDIALEPGDAVVGGYIEKSQNFEEFWGPYHFTDIKELTVNDDGTDANMFADLDTGKLINPPDTLDNSNKSDVLGWITNNGIDLMGETSQGVQGLVGFNIYAAQVDNFFWDADKSALVPRLSTSVSFPVLLRSDRKLPVTYLIETTEHKYGVLQILGFTENPKAIKIRYKLMEKSENTADENSEIINLDKVKDTIDFTMPVYDMNFRSFKQYIGGNIYTADNYIRGIKDGDTPEDIFENKGDCIFFMKAGHEFVPVRGTIIAPLDLPENWSFESIKLTKGQLISQIKLFYEENPGNHAIKLKEHGTYTLVTPENKLFMMVARSFSPYQNGAEATGLTFFEIGLDIDDTLIDVQKSLSKESNQFKATLPTGETVELLGVCDIPSEGKQWWAADGSVLENVFWDGTAHKQDGTIKARQVVFRIKGNESDPDMEPSVSFDPKRKVAPQGPYWSGAFIVSKNGKSLENLRGCSFSLHNDDKSIDIAATAGYGNWQTQAAKNTSSVGNMESTYTNIGMLILNDPYETNGKAVISATLLNQVEAWRIIAIDKHDKIHTGTTTSMGSKSDTINNIPAYQQFKAEFSLPLSEIKEIQFQTRKFEKFTFKNVSLEPGIKTDANVELQSTKTTVKEGENKVINVKDNNIGGSFSTTLPSGVRVELVGLCREPVNGAKWWTPDGSEMPEPSFEVSTRTPPMGDIPTRYTFLAKAYGGEDVSMKAKIYEGFGNISKIAQDGSALCFINYPEESKPHHEDGFEKGPIEIGIAQGQWLKGRGGIGEPTLHIPRSYLIGSSDEIVIQPPRADNVEPDIVTNIWASVTSYDYEFKLVCKLKDGGTRESEQAYFQSTDIVETGGLHNSALKTLNFTFDRLTYDKIVDYELFYRKYEFARFDNVAFKPDIKTDLQIENHIEQGKIGNAEKVHFTTKNDEGEIVKEFGAEKISPNEDDSVWALEKVYMNIYRQDFKCFITGDKGIVSKMSDDADVNFSGNVIIHLVPNKSSDFKEFHVYLDNLSYSGDKSLLSSDGSTKIISGDSQILCSAIELKYNDKLNETDDNYNLKMALKNAKIKGDFNRGNATIINEEGKEIDFSTGQSNNEVTLKTANFIFNFSNKNKIAAAEINQSQDADKGNVTVLTNSNLFTLLIKNPDGEPVSGAKIYTRMSIHEAVSSRQKFVSDEKGVVQFKREDLFQTADHEQKVLLYALDSSKKLAGFFEVSQEDMNKQINWQLQAACKVSGLLESSLLMELGQNIEWSDVYVYKDNYNPLSYDSESGQFEFYLPEGKYNLRASASDTYSIRKEIEVQNGQKELEVKLDLPADVLASLYGKTAPDFSNVKGWINSKPLKLSDLKGKVVILDFWGYWCGPCIAAMPDLMNLYEKFGKDELVIIGVHDDSLGSVEELQEKLESLSKDRWSGRKIPFPIVLDGGGETKIKGTTDRTARGATTAAYGIQAWPTTVFIDKNGNVVKKDFHPSNPDAAQELEDFLGQQFIARRSEASEPVPTGWLGGMIKAEVPDSKPQVHIYRADNNSDIWASRSTLADVDKNGNYAFLDIPFGKYWLEAEFGGMMSESSVQITFIYPVEINSSKQPKWLNLDYKGGTGSIEVKCPGCYSVTIFTYDSDRKCWIDYAKYLGRMLPNNKVEYFDQYEFKNLPPGKYGMIAVRQQNNGNVMTQRAEVELKENENVSAVLPEENGTSVLEGKVSGFKGDISDLRVIIRKLGSGPIEYATIYEASTRDSIAVVRSIKPDGSYRCAELPAGEYVITAAQFPSEHGQYRTPVQQVSKSAVLKDGQTETLGFDLSPGKEVKNFTEVTEKNLNKTQIILQADVVTIKQPLSVINDFLSHGLGIGVGNVPTISAELTDEQTQKFKEWAGSLNGTNIASSPRTITYDGQSAKMSLITSIQYELQEKDANSPSGYKPAKAELKTGFELELVPQLRKEKGMIRLGVEIKNSEPVERKSDKNNQAQFPAISSREISSEIAISIGKYYLIPLAGISGAQSDKQTILLIKADVQDNV